MKHLPRRRRSDRHHDRRPDSPATPQQPTRFVIAPVVDGAAAWHLGVDLVLTPLRLSAPLPIVGPWAPRVGPDR